jgi:predicted phage terminase large subunit-like protein
MINLDDHIPEEGLDFLDWSPVAKAVKREMMVADHVDFSAFFFPLFEGSPFIMNEHHRIICDTLDKVYTGEITRLVINIPPGYTKTQLAVINFIARGFAINPRCRFVHLSTSDTLIRDNSGKIQDIIKHPYFQHLWPMPLKKDAIGKHHWKTVMGGEMLAMPTSGGVIGLRAGRPDHAPDNFTGAIIVDDPIKPIDALSDVRRKAINSTINSTVGTRVMVQSVPIIIIMQRVHENDPADYVLSGGSGEKWHWLCMPALNESGKPPPLPDRYKEHATIVDYTLPKGALWKFKHTESQLRDIREARTDEDVQSGIYVFNAQYQQAPASVKTGLFKKAWFPKYDHLPVGLSTHEIYIDTASKDGEANDWSVLICAALGFNAAGMKVAYIVDLKRAKLELPQLIEHTKLFWEKMKTVWIRSANGNDVEMSGASQIKIEDKGHGTGLIQALRQDSYPATGIPRSVSKIERAIPCIGPVQAGRVLLPSGPTRNTDALWVHDFLEEVSTFNQMMTHGNDDQCDVLFDVIQDLLLSKGQITNTQVYGGY